MQPIVQPVKTAAQGHWLLNHVCRGGVGRVSRGHDPREIVAIETDGLVATVTMRAARPAGSAAIS